MQQQLSKLFGKVNKEKYSKYLELIPDFKKEKAQKFTTIVLTIIAVIILAIFAINPTLSTIANLQKQLDDAKFVNQKLEEKINDLSILQTKYNSIGQDLPVIYEAIPKSSEAPKITGQIQALVTNSGLSLVNVQIDTITKSPNNFYYFNYNVSATGSYENIASFLDSLINMQRISNITGITILQGEKSDSPLQVSVKAQAFFKE